MRSSCSPLALLLATLAATAFAADYSAVPDWTKLPDGRTVLGPMHGDVAVSAKGEVYVSVMDPAAGLQVFAPDGKFARLVPNAPPDLHGFVIHREAGGEFLYGARLLTGDILKLTLDGKEVLRIPATAIPDQFKKAGKDGKLGVRLTAMDVAPDGDLFVSDGYGSDYVHRFDKSGKYLKSFGGKQEPYKFATLHKIAIDTRFDPPRIIGVDRANGRVIHMSLEGALLAEVAKDLMMPAAVALHGELAAIGEIKGRITLLDKAGAVVARIGANDKPEEAGTNKTEPDKWRTGVVTAPHGVAFDAKGSLFVSEYNLYGRIHRFDRKQSASLAFSPL